MVTISIGPSKAKKLRQNLQVRDFPLLVRCQPPDPEPTLPNFAGVEFAVLPRVSGE